MGEELPQDADVVVEVVEQLGVDLVGPVAILGNLLDNAIEAARQVPDPSRRTAALTIRRIHQMLVRTAWR